MVGDVCLHEVELSPPTSCSTVTARFCGGLRNEVNLLINLYKADLQPSSASSLGHKINMLREMIKVTNHFP